MTKRTVDKWLMVAGLLLFFGLALHTARQKSPVVDEPVHLLRGYVLRQWGDLRQQFQHTPLSHRLIGLLLLTGADMPYVHDLETWPTQDRPLMADELLWHSGLDADRLLFLGRVPIIWLGLLLGAVAVRWVWQATRSKSPALVILFLFAASPNWLASAALATTDLAAAATYFTAVFAWWRYWRRPGWAGWLLTAVCLGLALAAKLTGILILPITLALAYAQWRPGQSWWRPGLVWAGLLPLAVLTLWAVYGFEVGLVPGTAVSAPAPTYFYTWQEVLNHVERGHESFFLGQISTEGWWSYFLVTFLIKTPAVTLLLWLLSVPLRRDEWREAAFVWLPPLALLAVASVSRLNIGYRHILPALPFVWVAAGTAVSRLRPYRAGQLALGVGLIWYVVAGIRQNPDHLAYFNEFVGGSSQGIRYLSDSNLDWGQDLKELAVYAQSVGGELNISYSGAGYAPYYGLAQSVHFDEQNGRFAPANPAPGRYAISSNHLQGLGQKRDLFDWFRGQPPAARVGQSILVYEVAEQAAGEWVAHCTDPAPLQTPSQAERLVGQSGLRHLYFDCRQTWIFPNNGRSGWYILPHNDEAWWPTALMADDATMPLVYNFRDAPTFTVYYWPGDMTVPEAFPFSGKEGMLANGRSVSLPVLVGETAELQAYTVRGNTWLTLWQAQAAGAELLSMQAHLATAAATPLVADSLGFSSEQWQPGDFWVQRHVFAEENGRFMETGLYNYLTSEPLDQPLRLPTP